MRQAIKQLVLLLVLFGLLLSVLVLLLAACTTMGSAHAQDATWQRFNNCGGPESRATLTVAPDGAWRMTGGTPIDTVPVIACMGGQRS
jgi:hypothetical protein